MAANAAIAMMAMAHAGAKLLRNAFLGTQGLRTVAAPKHFTDAGSLKWYEKRVTAGAGQGTWWWEEGERCGPLGIAHAMCLLWQDDTDGALKGRTSDEALRLTVFVGMLLDGLVLGRFKLVHKIEDTAAATTWRKVAELRLVVTEPPAKLAEVSSDDASHNQYRHLHVIEDWIYGRKDHRAGLDEIISQFTFAASSTVDVSNLVRMVFADLANFGAAKEEKTRVLGFLWHNYKFPTADDTIESQMKLQLREFVLSQPLVAAANPAPPSHRKFFFSSLAFLLRSLTENRTLKSPWLLKTVFTDSERKESTFTTKLRDCANWNVKTGTPIAGDFHFYGAQ